MAALDCGALCEGGSSGSAVPGLADSRRESGNGSFADGAFRHEQESCSSEDMATPTETPNCGSTTDEVISKSSLLSGGLFGMMGGWGEQTSSQGKKWCTCPVVH